MRRFQGRDQLQLFAVDPAMIQGLRGLSADELIKRPESSPVERFGD